MKNPHEKTADSRQGFSKGDRVHRAVPDSNGTPDDGIVQGWTTENGTWRCIVLWGHEYTGKYEAHQIVHAR